VHGRIYDPLLKFYNSWLHRVWLVTQTTKLFYSVVGAALYVTFGEALYNYFIPDIFSNFVFMKGIYFHYI
jgi:hypothetical protein